MAGTLRWIQSIRSWLPRAELRLPMTSNMASRIDRRLAAIAPTVAMETRSVGRTITTVIRQTKKRPYLFGLIVIEKTVTTQITGTRTGEG